MAGGDEVLELVGEVGVGLGDGAEPVDAVDVQVVHGVLDGVLRDGGRVVGEVEEDGQGAIRAGSAGGGVDDLVRDRGVLARFPSRASICLAQYFASRHSPRRRCMR